MKAYRFILFDLDGTLIYSHPGIYSCFRYALREMGEPAPTKEQLAQCIGPSLMYSFQNYFGMDEEKAKIATAKYREEYSKTGVRENDPIEGSLEGMRLLKEKGYILGLATSKPAFYAKQIVDRLGFSEFLTATVGSGMDGSLPTKADVIEEALKQLGAVAEETLMVGDRIHDLEGARAHGVDCALLRVGYAPEGELDECAPEYLFEGFVDFTAALIKNK